MKLNPIYKNKSATVLNSVFFSLIVLDSVLCLLLGNYKMLIPHSVFVVGLIISRILINKDRYEASTLATVFSLYIAAILHVLVFESIVVCNYILLCIPIVCSILLKNFNTKIFLIVLSSVLFLFCNYLVGLYILDNYLFFVGLFTVCTAMLYFDQTLTNLTNEKNDLINELGKKNDKIMLFSNMMSHDLKAPVQNIVGLSGLLQKKMANVSNDNLMLLNHIISISNSMKKLVDDLQQYSKSDIDSYNFSLVNVDKLIDDTLSLFYFDISKKEVIIDKHDLAYIYGDYKFLCLVFQNLISNSLKYQPLVDGHVPKISISQLNSDSESKIIICDNGLGIEEVKFGEIFEPFKRLHTQKEYEGTGLGLSLVKKVIEKHNGKIQVKSKLGEGTKITIAIPRQKVPQYEAA